MKTYATISLFLFVGCFMSVQAQVDYEEDIQPIFDQHCTSCHGSNSGVTLSSYDAVMNSVGSQYGTNIVEPGEPDESPLVDKIEPNPENGARMPQNASPLSDEEIQLIRTWIAEGANEMAVSTEQFTGVPKGFEMIGNYPNPFNPQTVITFSSPEKANYSVDIYNSAGMLVTELSG
ncbi:MAG TPA: hypothetical protein DD671_02000, partial [Balneolaceae bacterium]|nr:hypothetical protein [Balneolaceae bacterium]